MATSNWSERIFLGSDSEIFLDEVDSSNNYTNPLLDTISAGRIGDAQYLIELLFEDELDYGYLSYVMAYSQVENESIVEVH